MPTLYLYIGIMIHVVVRESLGSRSQSLPETSQLSPLLGLGGLVIVSLYVASVVEVCSILYYSCLVRCNGVHLLLYIMYANCIDWLLMYRIE